MLKLIGRVWLALVGWTAAENPPALTKCVVIAAPHTSNWDLVHMVAISWVYGVELSFMTKHTLFWPPLGWLLHAVGAVPVDRRARHNLVAQTVEFFQSRDRLMLAVPAEGTRGRTEFWKSGFYRIALAADVPIVLGYLDYRIKEGGLGPQVQPTGDLRADMDQIRAFYTDKTGRHPEQFGPIRLRDEDPQA